jgi:hypothetical protein
VRAQKLETLKRALARGLSEDLGEEDIVGLVLGFELVATDGAVGSSPCGPSLQGRSREPKLQKRTWSCGPVGVVNGLRGKESSLTIGRGLEIFLGSARMGMG